MAKTRPRNPPRKRDRAPVEGPAAPAAERSKAPPVSVSRSGHPIVPFTDEENALYFGAPEETPIARRDAAILGHARKVEAHGNNVVNLLSELEFGEIAVSRFERRAGKAIEWGLFRRVPLEARRQDREDEEIKKETRAITEGPYISLAGSPEERRREEQEYRAARRAQNEERRRKLEADRIALRAEWEEMRVLRDLIRDERDALKCPRVRRALENLRASALMYADKDLRPEPRRLLDLIGKAIAHPKKYKGWKLSEQENKVRYLWNARARYSPAAFEAAAEGLFPPNKKPPKKTAKDGKSSAVAKLEREYRRYNAKALAKEARLRRSAAPRPARSGRAAPPDEKG
jgi:hypothetical protein